MFLEIADTIRKPFKALKNLRMGDRLLLFYIFIFPPFILLFGTVVPLKKKLLEFAYFFHERIFIGILIAMALLGIAIAVFRKYLKRFYIYKKHISIRCIYFIPLSCLLVMLNWGLLIKKFNYKDSLIPYSNDSGAILSCVILAFLYLSFLVPLEKICERIPWFPGNITTCQAISNFRKAHEALKRAISNQIECFKNCYEKISSENRRFVIEKLQECSNAFQELIDNEKNSSLKLTYNQTKSDITLLLTLITDFETDLDYARFITEEEIYMTLPSINEYSQIFKRFLSLNY